MSEETKKETLRLSSKELLIGGLKKLIDFAKEKGEGNNQQIALLTTYGFILGDLEKIAEKEEEFLTIKHQSPDKSHTVLEIDISYLVEILRKKLDELSNEKELTIIDNYAVLNLRNVEIYKDDFFNPVAKMNQLLVFSDQVIGFTLANRNAAIEQSR